METYEGSELRAETFKEQMDLKELFDFNRYTYEVLFTRVEKPWFFKLLSRKNHDTLYYIRRVKRLKFEHQRENAIYKEEPEFLVQGCSSKKYFFTTRSNIYKTLMEMVYWGNSQEPSELITRLKMSASGDDPYVVFSSDDLQD